MQEHPKSMLDGAQPAPQLTVDQRAAHRRKILRDLQSKAEEYLSAVALEVGLRVDEAEANSLRTALRQDFIEVHNAALTDPVPLPVTKDDIAKLLDSAR
jgi:hypothetical protein